MSQKQAFNWLGQQRVDLPHLKMLENSILFDDQTLWSMLQGDTPYILTGFNIATPWAAGNPSNSLQVVVASSAVTLTQSVAGSYLQVPSGTPNEQLTSSNTNVVGSFTPSSTNFVAVQFNRVADPSTADLIALWDQDAKSEFTETVPLGLVLNYQFVITTTGFGTAAPIAIVRTDAFNNIIDIENAKQNLFRLGSGGSAPDINHEWTFASSPENPLTATSSTVDPFASSGDWEIANLKNWMDAVMTAIKQIRNSAFWYMPSTLVPDVNLSDLFFDTDASVLTMRGKFTHSQSTPGLLIWSGDLNLRSIMGPLTFVIPANNVTLSDSEVAYITLVRNFDFQPSNQFTFTNGSPTVTATTTISGVSSGDWVKYVADDMSTWAQVLTVVGPTITLTSNYTGSSSIGKALMSQGSYTMQTAAPESVPASNDTFWIAKRDDNGTITATIAASPTGASRSSGITTFQTTGAHGINPGQGIEVAGVTDTSFNGFYQVLTTPLSNTLTVSNPGTDGTSGSGTISSTATIYLRGIGEVSQGQSTSDVSGMIEALLEYTGSTGPGDTQPQYGNTNYVTQSIDLTDAISQLDGQAKVQETYSNQDRNASLTEGGTWSWDVVPNQVAWTADAFIQVPGLPDARNRIPAGTFILSLADEVAYVSFNRTGSTPATLAVSTALINSITTNDFTFIIARRLSDGSVLISNCMRLISQESKVLGMGLSTQTVQALGLTEAVSAPNYADSPAGSLALPNYNTTNGESFRVRLGELTSMFADTKQDFNIAFDPGVVSWDGTNVTITGAQLSVPGTSVGAAPVSINTFGPTALAANSCVYVDISRTSGTALTAATSTLAALTPSQQRLVLVRNIGGNLLVR